MQQKHINIRAAKAKKRAAFGFKTLLQLAILAVIIAASIIFATGRMERISALEDELALVEARIENQLIRQQEIEDTEAYTQSIAFIEYIARNWRNLVHRDEIIFVMVDN